MIEKTKSPLTKVVVIKSFPWYRNAYKAGDTIEVEDKLAKVFISGQLAITPEEAEKRAAAKRSQIPQKVPAQRENEKKDEGRRTVLSRNIKSPGNTEPYKRRDMQAEGTKNEG